LTRNRRQADSNRDAPSAQLRSVTQFGFGQELGLIVLEKWKQANRDIAAVSAVRARFFADACGSAIIPFAKLEEMVSCDTLH
jgi:hypothetical protein